MSPVADPRVKAVADAMSRRPFRGGDRDRPATWDEYARVAVTALDAYDGPKFSSVVHECCERPTEADLRERIAQEIEAYEPYERDRDNVCAALDAAAAIARGQTP